MLQQKPSGPFQQQVIDRFGLLPNFFCSAEAAPGLIEELWAFAKSAYLDNPFPALFKERLFVYLSRFCPIRYCIVRHVGFLMGLGRPAGDGQAQPQTLQQVTRLLSQPLPDTDTLNQALIRLETGTVAETMPKVDTLAEQDLFEALAVIFLEPRLASRARDAVKQAYGEANFELLMAYLAFIRTAHFWTETHPELAYEPDIVALMEQHPSLTKLLLNPSEAEQVQQGELLRQALTNLQQVQKALHQSQQRDTFLLQLSDVLRPLTDSGEVQYQAARVLGEFLTANRVGYVETQPDSESVLVTRHYSQGVSSLEGSYRYQEYGAEWLGELQRGKTVAHSHIDQDATLTQAQKEMYATFQVGAMVNVPLLKQGRLVAILFVHFQQAHDWSTDELTLIAETAERTWEAAERVKVEEALRQSEAKFRRLSDSGLVAVAFFEIGGSIVEANDTFLTMLGVSREELHSHKVRWDVYTAPAWMPRTRQAVEEFKQTGSIGPYEKQFYHSSGALRWGIFAGATLGDGKTGVSLVVDITDRKQAEEALHQADRRKDEFLAMLAHELRNPMSTIRSGLHILTLTDGKDETSRATIAMMNRQTDHLVHMVDDLLDVSRISRGKIELHTERVNLVEVVQQATESVRALYQEQGRSLQVALPTEPIYLAGDATRLVQIVTNLLTNGARYTGEDGQVWVSLAHNRQEAIMEVRDNGIGLAADQLSAIFDLFVQVDNSLARSKGGLGLGLTLVKQLVELHGGRVEAQSDGLDKGSTFRVHLPTLETAPAAGSNLLEQTTPQTSSDRLLIIDDNADAAFTLAMLLKLKGYETHTRNSGRAGLDAAETLHPSAILLDLGMPDMDGFETCRQLRQLPWGGQVPVIALSGYGQQEDRQRTQAAGFTAHLVKPVDLDALLSLLAKIQANPKVD